MNNIIKCCLLAIPLLHSTIHAMDANTTDQIITWTQFIEKQQKEEQQLNSEDIL